VSGRGFVISMLAALLPIVARADSPRTDLLKDVGIDQKVGAQISPDITFRNERGQDVRLGDYFGRRPIVLALVYYGCPTLCTTVLNELNGSMNAMPKTFNVGEHYDVITISFDPTETPALASEKKQSYMRANGREHAAEGWHFLTGDEASIKRITQEVGFRYVKDPLVDPLHPKQQQYVHASGIMVLTPSGKIARYFYGIDYASRDLRLALNEAAEGQTHVLSLERTVLLFCFHYDPTTGKYTLAVLNLLKVGATFTLLLLGGFFWRSFRKDRQPRTIQAG
jgi:protein SCO1/2